MMRYLIFLLGIFCILGCAEKRNIKDASKIKDNAGLLVVFVDSRIDTNLQLQLVDYKQNPSAKDLRKENFTGPAESLFIHANTQKLWVIEMPEGEYMWGEVRIASRRIKTHGNSRFKIEKNKMNYVGNVKLFIEEQPDSGEIWQPYKFKMISSDKSQDIERLLKTDYPKFSQQLPVVNNTSIINYEEEYKIYRGEAVWVYK